MSHLHIPDGVLPLWLAGSGWLLLAILLLLALRRLGKEDRGRRLPLLGVMSAVMLIGMSTEIVPIAYHTNLSVLAGIVLGPALGLVAAFIVNLMLALFGHGGITVVGLNALVLGFEAALGHYLFRGVWSLLSRRQRSPAIAAGIATVLALLASSSLMVAIVGLSNLDPASSVVGHVESLGFRNPFEHGLVSQELLSPQAGHEEEGEAAGRMDLFSFARLVLLLGVAGWALEGVLIGAIVGFVHRVRSDLVIEGK